MVQNKDNYQEMPYYADDSETQQLYMPKRQPTPLEDGFRVVRLGLSDALSTVNDFVDIGKSHTETTLDQIKELHLELQKEENLPARLSVIGGLGAVGLMVGAVRGRRLKRLLFTSVGVGLGAAACYPQETRDTVTNLGANIRAGELPHIALDSVSMIDMGKVTHLAQSAFGKCSELAASLFNQAKSLSSTSPSTESEKKIPEKSTSLTFLPSTSLKPSKKFVGDTGMSKDEDKDMYTTRG